MPAAGNDPYSSAGADSRRDSAERGTLPEKVDGLYILYRTVGSICSVIIRV